MKSDKQQPKELGPTTPLEIGRRWFYAFWGGWIAGILSMLFTFMWVGCVGVFIGIGIFTILLQIDPPKILVNLLFVLTLFSGIYSLGSVVGYVQWRWALRSIIRLREWTRATILMVFVFVSVFVLRNELLVDGIFKCSLDGFDANCILRQGWLGIALLSSVAFGLAIALPHWWVLRRYLHHANWWIVANIVSIMIYYIMAAADLFSLGAIGILALGGIVYATLTGLTMLLMVRSEKQKRKTSDAEEAVIQHALSIESHEADSIAQQDILTGKHSVRYSRG